MPEIDDHGGWPALLGSLAAGRDLTTDEARAALTAVLAGEATPAQIAALIVALRIKGETVDEVAGMVDAMLAAAARLELPEGTIDIVGTGGTARGRVAALNVSTMASFVAAGAGATVCKHGNRQASSTSGSFDLLEVLGVQIGLGGEAVARCVAEVGVGFCFARTFHPAMRHAGPVRSELGIPTVFNVLGPLSHPGRVRRQVVGVGDGSLVELVAGTLATRGAQHALVVHGSDGLDELTLSGPSVAVEVRDGEVVSHLRVDPTELGLSRVPSDDMPGGDPARNAEIAREVLGGASGAARDIVVLNAASGLYVAGLAGSLAEGVEQAAGAIDDGRAAGVLDRLVALSATLAGPS